jgi:hypothetical protein
MTVNSLSCPIFAYFLSTINIISNTDNTTNIMLPEGDSLPSPSLSPPTTPTPAFTAVAPLVPTTVVLDAVHTTTPPPEPSSFNRPTIETLTWDHIEVDSDQNVVGVLGVRINLLSSKQLRTVCSRLNVRGVKNAKKQVMIDNITNHYKNRKAYDLIDSSPHGLPETNSNALNTAKSTTRKEIQCPFRLMNVLFSDQFAERFAATGNVASRDVLDTGLAGNDQHFWQCVRTAFVSSVPNAAFDELLFKEDVVLSLQSDDIDPSKVVPHEWKKLRTIWKATNSEYKAALSRFTVSGTHESDFWNFCNGRLEAYYLHKLLTLRPNLVGFVEAELPLEAALASNMTGTEIANRLNGNSPTTSDISSVGMHKRKRSPVSDAIENMSLNSDARAELAREKIRIIQAEETRQRENQQWKKEQEAIAREKAELEKDDAILRQWQAVTENLRLLRQDLRAPNITPEDSADILDDIKGLKLRKAALGVKLGIRDATSS